MSTLRITQELYYGLQRNKYILKRCSYYSKNHHSHVYLIAFLYITSALTDGLTIALVIPILQSFGDEILFKNNESIGKVEEYIITYLDDNRFTIKIKNNTDEYYIYFDDNTDINNIRLKPLPLFEGESEDSYAFLRMDYLKMNLDTYTETSECKLNVINEEGYNPITLKSEIGNLIELYGIENPYPKLYIYNNDLSKSTKPCSYIYSNENSLIKNMEAEITYISNKQDLLESNIQVNKKNPLNYWGIEKTDSINVIMFSNNLLKFPALVSSCSYKSNNDDKILQGNPAVVYYTDDIERDRNSVYEYYGPSSRPLDALNPSEYIMKLKYNETDKCYNLEFTKSVNWIKFDKDRKLIGNNFDGQGFIAGFLSQNFLIKNKKICIFGAGGAAVSIACSLAKQKIKSLAIQV